MISTILNAFEPLAVMEGVFQWTLMPFCVATAIRLHRIVSHHLSFLHHWLVAGLIIVEALHLATCRRMVFESG
jgi:hypothetical protein